MNEHIKTVTDTSYLGFNDDIGAYDRLVKVQIMMDKLAKENRL